MPDVLTPQQRHCINPTATSPLHVAYTQQGNQAGNACEEMAVGTRISLPAECQERTGQAGHRHAQIQNGNIRQRLFLARSRGMQDVCTA